jgi:hypothetical protein
MARLIYVPVLHGSAEMGSAAEGYKAAFVARFGEEKWRERRRQYDAIWQRIEAAIARLGLDPKQLKLYQDSLPVCGNEEALVRELAQNGSRNHQLLLRLALSGAGLIGTESAALLSEEYRLMGSCDAQAASALLERRDRFIAERIAATLGEDETGLLFIGALHRVARFLPKRIAVEYLQLPERDMEERREGVGG